MANSKRNKSIFNRIPIVDIGPLVMPDRNKKLIRETGDEIREACRSVGFFYIKNHQIPQSHLDDLIPSIQAFFNLPLEEKMKIHISKSDIFRGYTPLGKELTNDKYDWHECVDFGPSSNISKKNNIKKLVGPNQWPKNQNKLGDNIATIFAFLGMTIPRFFLALLIMYWLAIVLNSDNTGSMYSPYYAVQPMSFAKLWNGILHIWPIFAIAVLGGLAYNMRVMRGNLLDVMRMQYIETARAKGLSENQTLYRHAVPNALHPLIMFQGIALPYMLMGELEAAIVLSIPTAGPLLVESIQRQDTYTTAAILFCLTVILIIGNIIADILLAVLDPRVRQN